jgi:hypothetical protein
MNEEAKNQNCIENQAYFAYNIAKRRSVMKVYVANAPGADYDSEVPSGEYAGPKRAY